MPPFNTIYGEVRLLLLDDGRRARQVACVGEDEQAFYSWPGDVVWPKSDWRLVSVGSVYPFDEFAELERREFGRVWERRPRS